MTLGHTHHDAFEHIRTQHIASLAVDVSHYRHKKTGALHYHLASESDENVFLVALRTVPQDSTGVAHILEHTALCGSKKYPVRDPFFMMLRRSLNTFMNAFTSSDWTAYPFASQTPKDFENLLRIYLDAVFFSNLDPLDFAQEGHRIELSEPGNTDSPLVYKGVVFNEMKGAMSSVNSTLWQALSGELFDNTYHYNSGGDPENITDLSYDQLKQFYQTHYHPSNAIFMTFGNIPAAQHQAHFEALALREFDKSDAHIEVDLASAYTEPKRVSQPYSLDDSDDLSAKTHHVVGWKLGESTDLMAQLEAHLITNLLLENSASPLMAALETSDLGTAPSPLCGLEDSMREMVFCCGVAGSEPERAEAVEALILSVLETCATEGFPSDSVDAVLHQLELHQREITGDGMPYGLNLILQGLSAATHYADPVQLLNLEPAIAALKDKVKDADYLPGLVRSLLLDNPHRVTLTLEPDTELTARKQAAEAQKLEAVKASLTPEQLLEIDEQAKALLARQANVDDSSILPKVTKEDVAPHLHEPESQRLKGTLDVYCYPAGTNGLVYREMIAPIAEIDSQDLTMVPLYADFLTEVGLGNHDYLDVQRRQSATVGGIHAHTLWRTDRKADGQIKAYFALSAKALVANAEKQVALMSDTLAHPKFTEHKRLKELVSQRTQRRLNSITGSGHSLAMSAAAAAHDPLANLHDYLSGLRSTQALKALNEKLNSKSELEAFAEKLGNIHTQLCAGSWRHLVIGEEQHMSTLAAQLVDVSAPPASGRSELTQVPLDLAHGKQLWLTNTQVYFCAKAYKTVHSDHEDGPALTVLGGLLRNGFLHRAIREQGGAYGGGASQDSGSGVFRFYSYRDPRFGGTLDDFDASLTWLRRNEYTDEALEEAILGVIASLDKPGSPAGTCKQHFHNRLFDRTHQDREAFRQRILACSRDDIERAANRYFDPNSASIAVVAPKGTEDTESALVGTLGLRCFQV